MRLGLMALAAIVMLAPTVLAAFFEGYTGRAPMFAVSAAEGDSCGAWDGNCSACMLNEDCVYCPMERTCENVTLAECMDMVVEEDTCPVDVYLRAAQLSPTGSALLLKFSAALNSSTVASTCAGILSNNTILGDNPSCSVEDQDRTIRIQLDESNGSPPPLAVGATSVNVLNSTLRSAAGYPLIAPLTATIEATSSGASAISVIASTSISVGSCTSSVDVAPLPTGQRFLTYSWRTVSLPSSLSGAGVSAVNAMVPSDSSTDSFTLVLNSTTRASGEYVFEFTAIAPLWGSSDVRGSWNFTVSVSDLEQPVVTLLSPPSSFVAALPLKLTPRVVNECSNTSASVTYRWSVLRISDSQNVTVSKQMTRPQLIVAANVLSPGESYRFTLQVCLVSASTVCVTVNHTIAIQLIPISIDFKPYFATHSLSKALVLDASKTRDPNFNSTGATLTYTYSCNRTSSSATIANATKTGPCPTAVLAALSTATGNTVTLTTSALNDIPNDVNANNFGVIFTLTVRNAATSSSISARSVVIFVRSTVRIPTVQSIRIQRLNTFFRDTTINGEQVSAVVVNERGVGVGAPTNSLVAIPVLGDLGAVNRSTLVYSWSLSQVDTDTGDLSTVSLPSSVSLTKPQLSVPVSLLTADSVYVSSLVIRFNNESTSITATTPYIFLNGRPSGGALSVSPSSGTIRSRDTQVTFTAANWVDSQTPLYYQFGYRVNGQAPTQFFPTVSTSATFQTKQLPITVGSNTLTPTVTVKDVFGAQVTYVLSTVQLTVLPPAAVGTNASTYVNDQTSSITALINEDPESALQDLRSLASVLDLDSSSGTDVVRNVRSSLVDLFSSAVSEFEGENDDDLTSDQLGSIVDLARSLISVNGSSAADTTPSMQLQVVTTLNSTVQLSAGTELTDDVEESFMNVFDSALSTIYGSSEDSGNSTVVSATKNVIESFASVLQNNVASGSSKLLSTPGGLQLGLATDASDAAIAVSTLTMQASFVQNALSSSQRSTTQEVSISILTYPDGYNVFGATSINGGYQEVLIYLIDADGNSALLTSRIDNEDGQTGTLQFTNTVANATNANIRCVYVDSNNNLRSDGVTTNVVDDTTTECTFSHATPFTTSIFSSGDSLSTGWIVAMVIGGILLVAGAMGFIYAHGKTSTKYPDRPNTPILNVGDGHYGQPRRSAPKRASRNQLPRVAYPSSPSPPVGPPERSRPSRRPPSSGRTHGVRRHPSSGGPQLSEIRTGAPPRGARVPMQRYV